MFAYITRGPVARRPVPGSQEEFALHLTRRLVALGAASAIILTACGGASSSPASGPTTEPVTSEAPGSEQASRDYKACASFDAAGLGDKGFNDLAQKGLEDAKAAGFQTTFTEARAPRTTRRTSSA